MTTAREPAEQWAVQRGSAICRVTGGLRARQRPAAPAGAAGAVWAAAVAGQAGRRASRVYPEQPWLWPRSRCHAPQPCSLAAAAGLTPRDLALQQLLQVAQVVVPVHQQARAVAPPQARAVHNAGVVELVRQDDNVRLCPLGGLRLLQGRLLLQRTQAGVLARPWLLRPGLCHAAAAADAAAAAAGALGACFTDDRGHCQVGGKAGGE